MGLIFGEDYSHSQNSTFYLLSKGRSHKISAFSISTTIDAVVLQVLFWQPCRWGNTFHTCIWHTVHTHPLYPTPTPLSSQQSICHRMSFCTFLFLFWVGLFLNWMFVLLLWSFKNSFCILGLLLGMCFANISFQSNMSFHSYDLSLCQQASLNHIQFKMSPISWVSFSKLKGQAEGQNG